MQLNGRSERSDL